MFSSNATQVSTAANYIEDVFSTWLYTGTGASQTITNNIDLSTKGGLVWFKGRSGDGVTWNNALFDTARGTSVALSSNLTNGNIAWNNSLSSFGASGFTVGADGAGVTNTLANNYASWTFAKQPKFFDVVTYTGNGSNRTIAHNLGSIPGCIMVKRLNATSDWQVYHRSLGSSEYMVLNATNASVTGATRWNNTTPTDTVFSVGTDATVNASGGTYVAYIFAHDSGGFGLTGTDNVISCGLYTGNGSTTGPIVTLGYEPQWILIKQIITSSNAWYLLDNMRGVATGGVDADLFTNYNFEEISSDNRMDFNSTGFQLRTTDSAFNANGNGYIYIAIRRGPMKVPTDATKVFLPNARTGNASLATVSVGFNPDWILFKNRLEAYRNQIATRLAGNDVYLTSTSTAAEAASGDSTLFTRTSNAAVISVNNIEVNANTRSYIDYYFGRAPGFFDQVCYTGTSSVRTVNHNLTVVPELIIFKTRSAATNWYVYAATSGQGYYILNFSDAFQADTNTFMNNTTPTSSVFTLGAYGGQTNPKVNISGATYVAYLFASCPGVSKVGSYTGNGTTQTINCGFTGGARFVLIKRANSLGDWYVYDTARGMTVLTDPYLLLNSTAAETATLGSVTTVSTGFALNSAILSAINVNAASYIFLAIA
jgi:hypothetical protein